MMKFQDLGLSAPLLRAIEEKGYETPTPIQEQAIPPVLRGRDLQGCAQTGTGKTAAFTLPILQLLAAEPPVRGRREIRALVLTPTRELAIQIDECCRDYARHTPIRHCVIFGGVNQRPQVEALQQGVDLLVATPGRLLDLIGQGYITLDRLRFFVLDEADRMLDMGFIHDIRRILPLLPPKDIAELAARILHDPVLVSVTPPASVVETIAQRVHFAEKSEKSSLLIDLLRTSEARQVLVFTRTKHGADRLARILNKAGIEAAAIHGNKSQNARVRAMNDFKSGACRVLIATDIAARGIDIDLRPPHRPHGTCRTRRFGMVVLLRGGAGIPARHPAADRRDDPRGGRGSGVRRPGAGRGRAEAGREVGPARHAETGGPECSGAEKGEERGSRKGRKNRDNGDAGKTRKTRMGRRAGRSRNSRNSRGSRKFRRRDGAEKAPPEAPPRAKGTGRERRSRRNRSNRRNCRSGPCHGS